MADIIDIEILDDGTVSIKTSSISDTNHISADQLLDEMEELLGGESKKEERKHPHWAKWTVKRGGKVIRKAKAGK